MISPEAEWGEGRMPDKPAPISLFIPAPSAFYPCDSDFSKKKPKGVTQELLKATLSINPTTFLFMPVGPFTHPDQAQWYWDRYYGLRGAIHDQLCPAANLMMLYFTNHYPVHAIRYIDGYRSNYSMDNIREVVPVKYQIDPLAQWRPIE